MKINPLGNPKRCFDAHHNLRKFVGDGIWFLLAESTSELAEDRTYEEGGGAKK